MYCKIIATFSEMSPNGWHIFIKTRSKSFQKLWKGLCRMFYHSVYTVNAKKNQKNIISFYPIFFLVLFRWRCKCKKGGLSNIVLKKSNIIGLIINMTIQGKQKEWIYEWICDWRIGGMIDRWWITEKQNMRHAEINGCTKHQG